MNITAATTTIDGVEYTLEPVKIISTFLGREDHGIPTFTFQVEGAGWGISGGGYRMGPAATDLLFEILDVVGVDSWEKLVGQRVHAMMADRQLAGIAGIDLDKHVVFKTYIQAHGKDDQEG